MIAHEFNSMLKQTEKLIGYKDLPAPHDGCLCASGPNETLVVARRSWGAWIGMTKARAWPYSGAAPNIGALTHANCH